MNSSSWKSDFDFSLFNTALQVVINKAKLHEETPRIIFLTWIWFRHTVSEVQPTYPLNWPDGCWPSQPPAEISIASFFCRINRTTQPQPFGESHEEGFTERAHTTGKMEVTTAWKKAIIYRPAHYRNRTKALKWHSESPQPNHLIS